jgi:glycosyltransferase involved in cell wall biosynthesis
MEPHSSLISVVIPSYNHAHLIGRALASVLEQRWERLEVIVVDNHSIDDTDAVVAGFQDPRIRLLKVRNGGVIAVSRNVGIRAASGDWVAFLDSDDWWAPHKLQRCAALFCQADIIYHRLRIVPAVGPTWLPRHIRSWQVRQPIVRDLLLRGNPVATSSVLVRKALLDRIVGFNERRELVAAEDYDAWIRLAGHTDRFCFLPQTLGYYYYSQQSASRRDMSLPMREAVDAHCAKLAPAERESMNANAAYAAGRYAWAQGDLARARAELGHSLRRGGADIRLRSLVTLILLKGRQYRGLLATCLGRCR